jgi:hypothetical protein
VRAPAPPDNDDATFLSFFLFFLSSSPPPLSPDTAPTLPSPPLPPPPPPSRLVCSEPLSQVTDVAFQEAQDASSFGQLLLVAQLQEDDPLDDVSLLAPTTTSVNDVQPSTAGSAYDAPAAVVAPIAAAATTAKAPPPSATPTTQSQLPFKKRKSGGGGHGDSSKKKKPLSPTTPSTTNSVASLDAPSTATPRGVEAALVMDTIAKRVAER